MDVQLTAIGFVESIRPHAEDDFWGGEEACITLAPDFTAEALEGVSDFSHVEVLFLFHEVEPAKIVRGARHPRKNDAWPAVGIFAQRGKNRPNRIGSTICRVLRVDGTKLFVTELDAINGTPVLDIKPVMAEFLPRQEVRQPDWSRQLMRNYWLPRQEAAGQLPVAQMATMGEYRVSADPDELDVEMIHRFLSKESHWAAGISLEGVRKSLSNSFCFGGFVGEAQVAFGRLVTDYTCFGYVRDVFVLPQYRGRGYARQLIESMLSHPRLEDVTFLLRTSGAHGLYERLGFTQPSNPENFLRRAPGRAKW